MEVFYKPPFITKDQKTLLIGPQRINMVLHFLVLITGLAMLVYSANLFIEGSASVAGYFKIPPLLIGMVVVGFGTSVPELMVSAFSAYKGNSGIALGNAYGSNITNIALILGLTAIIKPIKVNSEILVKELPVLTAITLLSYLLVSDGNLGFTDSLILLFVFFILMGWSIYNGFIKKDNFGEEVEKSNIIRDYALRKSLIRFFLGFFLLIFSARILVWSATEIAKGFGVSDILIGLTIVALGTSLPELASSVAAAKKGEHDLALGNILGSNLFNTLAVVGLAGIIHPLDVSREVIVRDMSVMGFLTLSLFVICYGFKGKDGVINRYEGLFLFLVYIFYSAFLAFKVIL